MKTPVLTLIAGLLILMLNACATPPTPVPEQPPEQTAQSSIEWDPAQDSWPTTAAADEDSAEAAPEPPPELSVENAVVDRRAPPALIDQDRSEDLAEPSIGAAPERTLEAGTERSDGPATLVEPGLPAPDQAAAISQDVVLSGVVRVRQQGRAQPFAGPFLAQTVIAWLPADRQAPAPLPEHQIVTRQSRFFPQTLVVTSGTEIRFPNMDSIQHNVYSLTPGHQFDVGLYGAGEGRTHRFNGSGMVEIFCNVHPNMAAFLLVLDTPHFITPDDQGQFRLEGLSSGPGELLVWNYRTEEQLTRIPLRLGPFNEPLDLAIDITRPVVPQRTNKHGEPFRRR